MEVEATAMPTAPPDCRRAASRAVVLRVRVSIAWRADLGCVMVRALVAGYAASRPCAGERAGP